MLNICQTRRRVRCCDAKRIQPLLGNHAGAAVAKSTVLNPLTSIGPAMHGELLDVSHSGLNLRVPRSILVGSAVQIRTRDQVTFGEVRASMAVGGIYDIQVVVKRL